MGKMKNSGCGKWSEEAKERRKGKGNPNWKGDEVGYVALHQWIKIRLPKPDKCEGCQTVTTKLDLANISQKYLRRLDDWEYLCRRCHVHKDGRVNNLNTKNSFNHRSSLNTRTQKELGGLVGLLPRKPSDSGSPLILSDKIYPRNNTLNVTYVKTFIRLINEIMNKPLDYTISRRRDINHRLYKIKKLAGDLANA